VSEHRFAHQSESRWPVIFAILAVLVVLQLEPDRLRVTPAWFPYIAAVVLLIPMLGFTLTRNPAFLLLERIVIYIFATLSVVVMALILDRLINAIISPTTPIAGGLLFASAIWLWVINVFSFGLLYWQLDRGGPDKRAGGQEEAPDILFPEGPPGPPRAYSYFDYLFFAFTTSTAFSPTEMFPNTPRMKALMMLQSTISLVTIIVVASRAINILK
jgi:uncharacterized membrane protein